jgi:peptidoglycan biosynthesis protein MviN/MurJ (putative lipid II flippase)
MLFNHDSRYISPTLLTLCLSLILLVLTPPFVIDLLVEPKILDYSISLLDVSLPFSIYIFLTTLPDSSLNITLTNLNVQFP